MIDECVLVCAHVGFCILCVHVRLKWMLSKLSVQDKFCTCVQLWRIHQRKPMTTLCYYNISHINDKIFFLNYVILLCILHL